jgi:nickel/cobalt transporter (NicO) family protein
MIQIIIGSLLLSITHALIPNHWFPLVAVSRTEKWSRLESLKVTAITGSAHTISTIIVGIIIGFIGFQLSNTIELITSIIAPLLLITLGIIYIVLNFVKPHTHEHHQQGNSKITNNGKKKSKLAIVATLGTLMFFSPCIEIEAYYFTVGQYGWTGILTLSIVYLIVTVFVLLILVDLGRKSMEKLNTKLHFIGKYERIIMGSVLIILGLFIHFVNL